MESASQPVTQPLSDFDRKILGIMKSLGWGISASSLAEYADTSQEIVQGSLNWLSEQGLVESHQHPEYGWMCWYLTDQNSPNVCPICGERCKNVHGLAIHQARKHQDKPKPQTVWIDKSTGEDLEEFDHMSMDVEPRTLNFVQDIIKRFANLPGVSIRVTVEFKGAGA